MPLEIPPEWEYFVPDDDVAWIFLQSGVLRDPLDAVRDDGYDHAMGNHDLNSGLRFGVGNPDTQACHLGRERPAREYPEVPPRDCPGCGVTFRPDRNSRSYCSLECRPSPGRPRELGDVCCAYCGITFRPKNAITRFCSERCVALARVAQEFTTGCRVCGKRVLTEGSQTWQGSFCSHACSRVSIGREYRRKKRREKEESAMTQARHTHVVGKDAARQRLYELAYRLADEGREDVYVVEGGEVPYVVLSSQADEIQKQRGKLVAWREQGSQP